MSFEEVKLEEERNRCEVKERRGGFPYSRPSQIVKGRVNKDKGHEKGGEGRWKGGGEQRQEEDICTGVTRAENRASK